jgi:hypothetical protein
MICTADTVDAAAPDPIVSVTQYVCPAAGAVSNAITSSATSWVAVLCPPVCAPVLYSVAPDTFVCRSLTVADAADVPSVYARFAITITPATNAIDVSKAGVVATTVSADPDGEADTVADLTIRPERSTLIPFSSIGVSTLGMVVFYVLSVRSSSRTPPTHAAMLRRQRSKFGPLRACI